MDPHKIFARFWLKTLLKYWLNQTYFLSYQNRSTVSTINRYKLTLKETWVKSSPSPIQTQKICKDIGNLFLYEILDIFDNTLTHSFGLVWAFFTQTKVYKTILLTKIKVKGDSTLFFDNLFFLFCPCLTRWSVIT